MKLPDTQDVIDDFQRLADQGWIITNLTVNRSQNMSHLARSARITNGSKTITFKFTKEVTVTFNE